MRFPTHLSSGHEEQCVHNIEDGGDVKVSGCSFRRQKQETARVLITAETGGGDDDKERQGPKKREKERERYSKT